MRRELNSLKREVRSSPSSRKRNRDEDIKPSEAEMLIRMYLEKGLDDFVIAEKLRPLGPPINWTIDKITEFRKE